MKSDLLKSLVRELVESRMREADVSDGSRVTYGSSKHVKDLEARLVDVEMWRDKQRKGSSARADYARLAQRIKGDLRSALRAAEKQSVKDVYEDQKPKKMAVNKPANDKKSSTCCDAASSGSSVETTLDYGGYVCDACLSRGGPEDDES